MHPDLERLIRLQQIDLDVAAARQSIDRFPEQIAALDEQLQTSRTAVDKIEARQAEQKTARVGIEKELAEVEGRLARFKDQLMAVKTNKEFHAVQLEISHGEADKHGNEDRLLEMMIEADEIVAEADAARAALKTAEAEVAEARQTLEAERDRLQGETERKVGERAALVAELKPSVLALFESVASHRKGVAVSPMRDGRCGDCQVRLRPQLQNEVRRNDSLIRCESCQRILYYPVATAS